MNRHKPRLAELGLFDPQDSTGEINVPFAQAQRLRNPQAGAGQKTEQRAVSMGPQAIAGSLAAARVFAQLPVAMMGL
jgi:hypothetical protein